MQSFQDAHRPTTPPDHTFWPWYVLAAVFKTHRLRKSEEVRAIGVGVLEAKGVPSEKHEEVFRQVFDWLEQVGDGCSVTYRLLPRAELTLGEGGWWCKRMS